MSYNSVFVWTSSRTVENRSMNKICTSFCLRTLLGMVHWFPRDSQFMDFFIFTRASTQCFRFMMDVFVGGNWRASSKIDGCCPHCDGFSAKLVPLKREKKRRRSCSHPPSTFWKVHSYTYTNGTRAVEDMCAGVTPACDRVTPLLLFPHFGQLI